jgi:hypothetical protein
MADETTPATPAVKAQDYYRQHAAEEREYARVYVARPAGPGDSYVDGVFEKGIREAGYKLSVYTDVNTTQQAFLNTRDFDAQAKDASKLRLPVPREDLSAEDAAKLTPVGKGRNYVASFFEQTTGCDGFLCKTSEGQGFISNYALTTAFNYAGAKVETEKEQLVTLQDEPMLKGFILAEDVTFAFKAGNYEAKKGSFLYVNAQDEDGYTVMKPGYAQFALRRNPSAEEIAEESSVALNHSIAVGGPMKLKKHP